MTDSPRIKKSATHEIKALTGIRGVASVWVVCRHFYPFWILLLPGISVFTLPFSRGDFAVDIFFVLSGFILGYVYSKGSRKFGLSEYGDFLWHRIARIYPVHIATLAIMVGLVLAGHVFHVAMTGSRPFSHLPYQLTLTQMWPFVPRGQAGEWVSASWSISAEWFAYIFLFPCLIFVLHRQWSPLILFALAYTFLGMWIFDGGLIAYSTPIGLDLLKAILEFIVGGLIFGVYSYRDTLTSLCQKYVSVLAAYLVGMIIFSPLPFHLQQIATLPIIPVLLIGLTSKHSLASRLLSCDLSLWLGRVSYALYLGHPVALRVIKILLPWERYEHDSLPLRFAIFAANLFIILGFTVVLHYFIEVPARNYLRKMQPLHFYRSLSSPFKFTSAS